MSSGSTLRFPVVELPPQIAEVERPRSLAIRAGVSVALLVGAFVLALAVIAVGVGLNVLAYRAGSISGLLVAGTVAVVLALGGAIVVAVRVPDDPADEIVVPEVDEPVLHREVAALAERAGTKRPDRIVLIPDVNAYVREFGPMFGLLPGSRVLAIGSPLLEVLTVSQLRAVLAHELGHFAGGDTRLGPVAYRTERFLAGMVRNLGGSLTGQIFEAYWHLQYRVSASVRRGQELVADRASVRVAGRQASADALQRIEITARARRVLLDSYVEPLLRARHRPGELSGALCRLIAERIETLSDTHSEPTTEADPYATHPPTRERIARIAALPETHEAPLDERPARELLTDPDGWLRRVDRQWLDLVVQDREFVEVEWSDFADLAVAEPMATKADEVDAALAKLGLPAGLGGMREVTGRGLGRQLVETLARPGNAIETSEERQQVLQSAIESVAYRDAVSSGLYEVAFSWVDPYLLRTPDGQELHVAPLADRAASGDWDERLQSLIGSPAETRQEADPSQTIIEQRGEVQVDADAVAVPSPPFEQSRPGVWMAKLGGRRGRTVTLAIGPDALSFQGVRFRFSEIEGVTISLSDTSSLPLDATIEITGGWKPALANLSISDPARADAVALAAGYLWDVMSREVAPRLAAQLSDILATGGHLRVGGVELDDSGLTAPNADHVRWSDVADPLLDGDSVVIPHASATPLRVSRNERDSIVLVAALPQLRRRFAVE